MMSVMMVAIRGAWAAAGIGLALAASVACQGGSGDTPTPEAPGVLYFGIQHSDTQGYLPATLVIQPAASTQSSALESAHEIGPGSPGVISSGELVIERRLGSGRYDIALISVPNGDIKESYGFGESPSVHQADGIAWCDDLEPRQIHVARRAGGQRFTTVTTDAFEYVQPRNTACRETAWSSAGQLAMTTWSDDGVQLAAWTNLRDVRESIELPELRSLSGTLSWSSDARLLAVSGSALTLVVDTASRQISEVDGVEDPQFSPTDPNLLAGLDRDGQRVVVFSLRDNAEVTALQHIEDNHVALVWSPDGRFIALTTRRAVAVWDTETEQVWRPYEADYPDTVVQPLIAWGP